MSVEVGAACHYTTKNILDKSHISLKKGNNKKNMVKIIKNGSVYDKVGRNTFFYIRTNIRKDTISN